jgi:hypothetical protein
MPSLYTRRQALAGIAATTLALSTRSVMARQAAPHRIDVHAHFVSPNFQAVLTKRNGAGLGAWKGYSRLARLPLWIARASRPRWFR